MGRRKRLACSSSCLRRAVDGNRMGWKGDESTMAFDLKDVRDLACERLVHDIHSPATLSLPGPPFRRPVPCRCGREQLVMSEREGGNLANTSSSRIILRGTAVDLVLRLCCLCLSCSVFGSWSHRPIRFFDCRTAGPNLGDRVLSAFTCLLASQEIGLQLIGHAAAWSTARRTYHSEKMSSAHRTPPSSPLFGVCLQHVQRVACRASSRFWIPLSRSVILARASPPVLCGSASSSFVRPPDAAVNGL